MPFPWILLVDHFFREKSHKRFGSLENAKIFKKEKSSGIEAPFLSCRKTPFECKTVGCIDLLLIELMHFNRNCINLTLLPAYEHDFRVEFRFIAKFNQIYEIAIAGFFSWFLSTMCILLVILQIHLVECIELDIWNIEFGIHNWIKIQSNLILIFKDKWSLDTLAAIILVLWAFILMFISCDFGQNLTNQFELFEYEFYTCKWYLLSIELQRIYAFAAMNVQRSVSVQGFGNIQLTHETSKKVANEWTL